MSEEAILRAFNKSAAIYGNVMDEIRQRIAVVEKVIDESFEQHLEYWQISDLCCLQFRKLCELVAGACLIAHGNIPATKNPKLTGEWNADKLLKQLERLHADFYPKPCTAAWIGGHIAVSERDGRYLTKERLVKIYHYMDGELHVGGIEKRPLAGVAVDRASFQEFLSLFRTLLFDHFVVLNNPNFRFVVQMNDGDGKVRMTIQRADARPRGSIKVFGEPHVVTNLDISGTIQAKPAK